MALIKSLQKKIKRFQVYRRLKNISVEKGNEIRVFIFSKDRPIQLCALLESFHKHNSDNVPITVIYTASSKRESVAYLEIAKKWSTVNFTQETLFRETLIHQVSNAKEQRIVFLVDDIIFTNSFSFSSFEEFDLSEFIPSLRHGKNITYSYVRDKDIIQPNFSTKGVCLIWSWIKRNSYWSYPLSVDGHLYYRDEIKFMLEQANFKAPNSLENAMQLFADLYRKRKGVCFEKSVMVNVPWNIVQVEQDNLVGDISSTLLLEEWENGNKINISSFENIANNSCHQIYPLQLTARG